jgi:hypothetical protein
MAELEDRADGRELIELDEPGSDERLSDEAKARIAEAKAEQVTGSRRDRDPSSQ